MKIPKPTEDDKRRFVDLVPERPNVEVKPMFGNVGGFVNGNMFMGLFGPAIGVRLPEGARTELLGEDGAGAFGPEDRPMKEYVALPATWVLAGAEAASDWIDRAYDHVAAMPAKTPKKK